MCGRAAGTRREGAGIRGTVADPATSFNGTGRTETNQLSGEMSRASEPSVSSAQSHGAAGVPGKAGDAWPEDRVAFGAPRPG